MSSHLEEAARKLYERSKILREILRNATGETAAPGYWMRCATADATRTPLLEELCRQIHAELDSFSEAVRSEIEKRPQWEPGAPLSSDKVWLWGGPTPEWGGSMQPDTLVSNARYFNIENGVYVYGATSEEMIQRHAAMKQLLCMVSSTCRAPGQQPETDAECAEKLSRLSLKYPNIRGGMMDDMTNGSTTISKEKVEQIRTISTNLKKHNPALELYGVIYQHELAEKDFTEIVPYLDGVNLWFWNQEKLLDLEKSVDHCRYHFPKKKILLGLFIHDYGTSDTGTLPELLLYELKGARALLAKGKIDGVVVLGDREVLKWPEQAALVRGFLEAQL